MVQVNGPSSNGLAVDEFGLEDAQSKRKKGILGARKAKAALANHEPLDWTESAAYQAGHRDRVMAMLCTMI